MDMEVLTSCLNMKHYSRVLNHWRTKEVQSNHISFADDVFLFNKGEVKSVEALMRRVNSFLSLSGLVSNNDKSHCLFNNVHEEVASSIIAVTRFQQGHLHITCLGLPLITSKLLARDCIQLVDKISVRNYKLDS